MQDHSTNKRYQELARKQLQGTISPEEAAELAQWLAHDDGQHLEVPAGMAESRGHHEKRLLGNIEQSLGWKRAARIRTLRTVAAAAAILLIAVLGWWLLKPSPVVPSPAAVAVNNNDPGPGGNRAVLTLGNGQRIVLDSAANGTLFSQGGIQCVKLDSGSLAYKGGESDEVQVHTLSTPIGGQFRITLSDGTDVWLNAASTLKFPSAFRGQNRSVEITGEAYFEVAHSKSMPFKVAFNGNEVEVLGTHFNVMAYPDETKSKVTLLEGSVAVSNPSGRHILKPGMQAQVGSMISISRANTEEAVAWKNGLFIFDNEDIHSIMRKLARWYNVQPAYTGDMQGVTFSGTVSRYGNVSGVLNMLEMTESVRFTLKGTTIQVSR